MYYAGKIVFFVISLIASSAIWYLFAILRASGLHDRRMKGFNALCVVVSLWIISSAAAAIVMPEIYPALYVCKELFLNMVPFLACYFLLNFMESKLAESKIVNAVFIIIPVISCVLLLTNTLHYQYIKEYGDPPVIGFLFYIPLTATMLTLCIIYVLLFRYVIKNYKGNPLLVISGIGTVIPIIFYMGYLFLPAIRYDITSMGFFLTIIIFAYASYAPRLKMAKPAIFGEVLAGIAKSNEIIKGTVKNIAMVIAKEGCKTLDAYRVGVWHYDEQSQSLKSIISYNIKTDDFTVQEDFDLKNADEYKELLETERLVIIDDMNVPNVISMQFGNYDSDICSLAEAPIRVGGNLEGVVSVEQNYNITFPKRRVWSIEEQSFISSLSDIMSIAITNAARQDLMHQLEVELSDKTEFANIAFEQAPIGMTIFGDNFNMLDCNDAILSILETTREFYMDNFGKFSPEYQPSGEKSADELLRLQASSVQQGTQKTRWVHINSRGEPIPCEITVASIKQETGYIGLAFVYDMRNTEKMLQSLNETTRQLEDALAKANEANKAKTDFLARMSHEIRTPMNAIIGMTELALREKFPEDKNEHIYTVKQAGSNLLAIINDILDFSKIEAGKMEIINEEYPVASFINDTVNIIRMRIVDSQLRFVVKADSMIPHMLCGDETRLRQVALNMLSNAARYTEEGFISFGLYGEIIDNETLMLTIEVEDSGIGIKPEDIDNLFQDFTQINADKNMSSEGIGLGLAITRNIIKAMGGTISVKSEYGKGSTFTAVIPQKYKPCSPLVEIKNPDAVKILVFERRIIYTDSIIYMFDNLDVHYNIVKTSNALFDEMESNEYNHLVIAHALYKKYKKKILELKNKTNIVLLTEFGDTVSEKGTNTIAMPVHCVGMAEILNGSYGKKSSTSTDHAAKFTAPDARILIVDDINTNLSVANGLMMPYEMHVDLCNGGAEVIELIEDIAGSPAGSDVLYDIIFMDHKMPVIDGVEATKRIRAMEGEYVKNVPIIALTANAVEGIVDMFLENGFDDFLSKPIDISKLNDILEKWIPDEKIIYNR